MKPTTLQHTNVIPIPPSELVDALQNATFPVTFRRAFVQYPGGTDALETSVTIYDNGTIFQNGILIYPGQDPSPVQINIPIEDFQAIRTPPQSTGETDPSDALPVITVVTLDPQITLAMHFPGIFEVYSSPGTYHQIPQFGMEFVKTGLILSMALDDIHRYVLELTSHPKLALEGGLCETLPFNYLGTELEVLIRNSGKAHTLTIKPQAPIAILSLKPRIVFELNEGSDNT